MEGFGRAGTRAGHRLHGRFREVGGRREGPGARQINDLPAEIGIRFLGPNCMGILELGDHLSLTVRTLDERPGPPGARLQSGPTDPDARSCGRQSIRSSKASQLGNEANIGLIDARPGVFRRGRSSPGCILYIEAIRDGAPLRRDGPEGHAAQTRLRPVC